MKNLNYDNSTQIVTKLKNPNCDINKKSNYDKTQFMTKL